MRSHPSFCGSRVSTRKPRRHGRAELEFTSARGEEVAKPKNKKNHTKTRLNHARHSTKQTQS